MYPVRIAKIVAKVKKISYSELISKSRRQEVAEARHMACALIRRYLKRTTRDEIRRLFNWSDTTSVNNALMTHEQRMSSKDTELYSYAPDFRKAGLLVEKELGLFLEKEDNETLDNEESTGFSPEII